MNKDTKVQNIKKGDSDELNYEENAYNTTTDIKNDDFFIIE